mgnify:CR=1 FL=1
MLDKAELLLPAGSLVKLKTAILYGADAVYAGTPDMCLRAQSKMTLEDLEEGIRFVHQNGKKIYLTLNLFMHNRDVAKLPQFVETLVFEDNVKAAFAVKNLHAGIAEFNLIVLTGKFGKNSLKVGRFVVFGIGCDFNLFFFVVFGADAVNRYALFIINQFFFAFGETRL